MRGVAFLAAITLLADTGSAQLPTSRVPPKHAFPKLGACYVTRIAAVEGRLEGDAVDGKSGSQVEFANGVVQVSYETVRGIVHSRVGDKVRMCVVELPSIARRTTSEAFFIALGTRAQRSGGRFQPPNTAVAALNG